MADIPSFATRIGHQVIFSAYRNTLDDTADFIADLIRQGKVIPGEGYASGHCVKQYHFAQ